VTWAEFIATGWVVCSACPSGHEAALGLVL
jgi:hypothetical protein